MQCEMVLKWTQSTMCLQCVLLESYRGCGDDATSLRTKNLSIHVISKESKTKKRLGKKPCEWHRTVKTLSGPCNGFQDRWLLQTV